MLRIHCRRIPRSGRLRDWEAGAFGAPLWSSPLELPFGAPFRSSLLELPFGAPLWSSLLELPFPFLVNGWWTDIHAQGAEFPIKSTSRRLGTRKKLLRVQIAPTDPLQLSNPICSPFFNCSFNVFGSSSVTTAPGL